MAPEQIEPSRFGLKEADHRADLYAVGVTLFELLGGRVPFDGETPWEIFRSQVEAPPPDLRALRPDLSPPLAAIIARTLAKAPSERYQTARELREALTPFAETFGRDVYRLTSRPLNGQAGQGSGPRSGPHSGPLSGPNPKPSSRTPVIAATIAAVAVIGVVLALIFSARSTGGPAATQTAQATASVAPPGGATDKPAEKPATPQANNTAPVAPARDLIQQARAALDAHDYDKAIQTLTTARGQVVAADPLAAEVTDLLYRARMENGEAMLSRKQFNQADGQFNEALALRPNDAAAQDARKKVVLADKWAQVDAAWGGDDEKSIALLQEILRIDPNNADARQKLYAKLVARGQQQLGSGSRDEAKKTLASAVDTNPSGVEARQLLSSLNPTATPLPPPTNTPPPPPTSTPARPNPGDTMVQFYRLIDQSDYRNAYTLASRSFQATYPYSKFSAWWPTKISRKIQSARVLDQNGTTALVETVVDADDAVGNARNAIKRQRVTEQWPMVWEDNQWKFDNTKVINSTVLPF
jgi:tetratricopeptide (TPR) repeat protein